MRSHQRNVSKGVTCSDLQKVRSGHCVENRLQAGKHLKDCQPDSQPDLHGMQEREQRSLQEA